MKNDILAQFRQLEFLFRRYFGHCGRRNEGGDPHRGQGRILSILKLQSEISQRELGHLLDMRKQSLCELLAKLESKGHITREASVDDRRMMQIKLTELGAQAAENISQGKQEQNDILDVLSDDEQDALSGYLKRLIDAMDAELGSDSDEMRGHCGRRGHHGEGRGHHGEGCRRGGEGHSHHGGGHRGGRGPRGMGN